MQTRTLVLALALASVTASAQAATWTLGATHVDGVRAGIVSLDALNAGTHLGSITDDLNTIAANHVAVGTWRTFTAALGGNAIDASMVHEAFVNGVTATDPSTVDAFVTTGVIFDNAAITSPTHLAGVLLAPVLLSQDFIITPELGESLGLPVFVTYQNGFDHSASLDNGFSALMNSIAEIRLNGVLLDRDGITGAGNGSSTPITFVAHIGDTINLRLTNSSQISAAGLALATGAMPQGLVSGTIGGSLTVSPIPEPETWAMLLAGLGLLGLHVRRKARNLHKLES